MNTNELIIKSQVEKIVELEKKIENYEKAHLELGKQNELKSNFVSTASHELRTPLSIIKEGITLILDGVYGRITQKQKTTLATVCDSIDRLARMINNLLDISKIEAGKMELRKSKIDLAEIFEKACAPFRITAKEKGIHLVIRDPGEPTPLYVDVDKVIQVFMNVLGNAVKFTPIGGLIKVVYLNNSSSTDFVQIAVSDTGVGIPEADLERVFQRFEQGENRYLSYTEKGTGLGLSITEAIVKLHKGRIWVESKEGKGSTFYFTLPKYIPEVIVRDEISNEMKNIDTQATNMSILSVSIEEVDAVKSRLPHSEFQNVVAGIKSVVKNTVRKFKDVSIDEGEELLMVLHDCNRSDVEVVKNRLKVSLDTYVTQCNLPLPITFNFGHASYPEDAHDEEALLQLARMR